MVVERHYYVYCCRKDLWPGWAQTAPWQYLWGSCCWFAPSPVPSGLPAGHHPVFAPPSGSHLISRRDSCKISCIDMPRSFLIFRLRAARDAHVLHISSRGACMHSALATPMNESVAVLRLAIGTLDKEGPTTVQCDVACPMASPSKDRGSGIGGH